MDKVVKAGCFSGGGADGSRVAGILYALKPSYDMGSGNSVGGLKLGAVIAKQWETLKNAFTKVTDKDIVKWSFFNSEGKVVYWKLLFLAIYRLIFRKNIGLLNTTPMRKYIARHITHQTLEEIRGKKVFVTIHSLKDRKTKYKNIGNPKTSLDKAHDAIWASANVPTLMTTVFRDGDEIVDGGVSEVTPLSILVTNGATDIDVFMNYPKPSWFNGFVSEKLSKGSKNVELSLFYRENQNPPRTLSTNYIEQAVKTFKDVHKDSAMDSLKRGLLEAKNKNCKVTIYWMPKEYYTSPYTFDTDKMEDLFIKGVEQANDLRYIDTFEF